MPIIQNEIFVTHQYYAFLQIIFKHLYLQANHTENIFFPLAGINFRFSNLEYVHQEN